MHAPLPSAMRQMIGKHSGCLKKIKDTKGQIHKNRPQCFNDTEGQKHKNRPRCFSGVLPGVLLYKELEKMLRKQGIVNLLKEKLL